MAICDKVSVVSIEGDRLGQWKTLDLVDTGWFSPTFSPDATRIAYVSRPAVNDSVQQRRWVSCSISAPLIDDARQLLKTQEFLSSEINAIEAKLFIVN